MRLDRRKRRLGALIVALVGGLFLLSACHGGAHVALEVTSTADAPDAVPGDGICDDGTGSCTLRAAIDEANAAAPDVQVDISLPSGSYLLEGLRGDEANATGDLDVLGRVRIEATGPATIDAQGVDRVLDVRPGGYLELFGVTVSGGQAGAGGGVRVLGELVAWRSTISGNTATYADKGGGLYVGGGGWALLNASTVSANAAPGGAGIATGGAGHVDLGFVTVTGNDGGGIHAAADGVTLQASMIVDQASGPDCAGVAPASAGYNVDADATCLVAPAVGDAAGASAPLAPLGWDGGTARTHLPEPGSAAIDRVPVGEAGCVAGVVDERGAERPKDVACDAGAVEVSVGLPGTFTVYAEQQSSEVRMVDGQGDLVHRWVTSTPVVGVPYLLPGGRVLRINALGGAITLGGTFEILDWDGTVAWSYESDAFHHDLEPLPDGNILMIGAQLLTTEEVVALGRDPAIAGEGLVAFEILELDPTAVGDPVVWRWSALDHAVQDQDPGLASYGAPADHPERIDLNVHGMELPIPGASADWVHANGIDYNAELDQIVVSSRSFSEVWVIDHSTTTSEAASHTGGDQGRGGDLLYRWGNPVRYGRGTEADQRLFRQHDPTWVPSGAPGGWTVLVFNNGTGRPGGNSSSVDEVVLPVGPDGSYPSLTSGEAFGPASAGWSWSAPEPTSFYEPYISGAQRVADGNTLVVGGWTGQIFEVAPDGTEVFRLEPSPRPTVFKARQYVDFDGTEPVAVGNAPLPEAATSELVGAP